MQTPRRLAYLSLPVVLLLAGLPLGCSSYEELAQTTPATSPNPLECGACHSEVAKEWRGSAHARAWTSEAFAETTHDYALRGCLGCHAPGSLYEAFDLPELRADRRAQGVDCQACHMDQGALVGPISDTGALFQPHPVRVDKALYRSAELCGRCHQGTYAEWQQHGIGEGQETCQECHMPEVTRTITQRGDVLAGVFPFLETDVPQRRHVFDLRVVESFEDAVTLDMVARQTKRGVRVDVTVTNLLPHLIPTGDFGFRKARLLIVGRGKDGEEVSSRERSFFKELKTALVPHEKQTVSVRLPRAATSIQVTLERMGKGEEGLLLIAERSEDLSGLLKSGGGGQ